MSRCVVVIPTYNESENLPLLVPQVLAQGPEVEVLVVDDASPDGTGKRADDLARSDPRVHVLHRSAKQGLGPAYRAGFARALELGADTLVQMDADFSHPPDVIRQMLDEIGDYDVVMGSRYVNGITVVNWPIERVLLSYYGNWYVRKVTGMPISDTTGGFRCIRREALEAIRFEQIRANGYAFQMELNYRFTTHGLRVKEIPFFFLDRTRGTSKLTLRIGLETLWLAWWLRINHLLGRL
ncbi:MAG: polyprenol monophosphomannose synthase [Myxococcota bacterium]